jgi:hypothetical protein
MYLGYTKHRTPQLGLDFSTLVWILYKPLKTFCVFLVVLLQSIKVHGAFMKSKGSQDGYLIFQIVSHCFFSLSIIGGYQPDTHWVSWKKNLKKKNFIDFYTM